MLPKRDIQHITEASLKQIRFSAQSLKQSYTMDGISNGSGNFIPATVLSL